jgi:hypothetical protein
MWRIEEDLTYDTALEDLKAYGITVSLSMRASSSCRHDTTSKSADKCRSAWDKRRVGADDHTVPRASAYRLEYACVSASPAADWRREFSATVFNS